MRQESVGIRTSLFFFLGLCVFTLCAHAGVDTVNGGAAVTNPGSLAGAVPDGHTADADPVTVSYVNPNKGYAVGGDAVTITGTGFSATGTTRVTFDGVDATGVTVANGGYGSLYITCTTPAHDAGAVDVTVINAEGGQGTLAGGFTYQTVPIPAPSAVSPNQGYTTGGETVYVSGTGFSLTGTTTVAFGGVPATSVAVQDTGGGVLRVRCTAPPHAVGAVDVVVTGPRGMTGTLAGGYTYVQHAAPAPTRLTPASGSYIGGTPVTIYGAEFSLYGTPRVTFGGIDATSVSVRNPGYGAMYLTCTTPPHVVGAVEVSVINPDGQSGTVPGGFAYAVPPPPVVNAITPNQGRVTGGTSVQITGSGFPSSGVPRVLFGGMEATSVGVTGSGSGRYIYCTTPAHGAGTCHVTVINPEGQETVVPLGFTFLPLPAPAPSYLSPNSGPSLGGTTVYVQGSNIDIASTTRILFDGVPATNVQVVSAGYGTQYLTCKTPVHPAGPADVTVINKTGESGTLSRGFTFTASPPPAPSSFSPAAGLSTGGTLVTVEGGGFSQSGKTRVTFDGVEALNVLVVSNGTGGLRVTGYTPAHAAGSAEVAVVNPDGQRAVVSGQFTYTAAAPPVPASVAPAVGCTLGGSRVIVSCAGLSSSGTLRVTFGGVEATDVVWQSADTLACRAPAHGVGAVDVTVCNGDGQSGTLAGGFSYLPPQVTAVTPSGGSVDGGTPATITGSCFAASGVRVLFDGVEAGDVVSSENTIVCTVPAHAAGTVEVTVINPDDLAGTLPSAFTYRAAGELVVRVDGDNVSGVEDGATWATAFTTIQQGIDAVAASGNAGEVWVAEGTYTAATAGTVVVTMAPFCDIYGGFTGVETRRDMRDFNAHPCRIDGMEESACVYGADNARLDGFGVTGGNGPARYSDGGTLLAVIQDFSSVGGSGYNQEHMLVVDNSGCSPAIVNCTFSGNTTGFVMVNAPEGDLLSNPLISHCDFVGPGTQIAVINAVQGGAACRPRLEGCTFTGWITAVGEMSTGGTSCAALSRCAFRGNRQAYVNGTIGPGACSTRFENCAFSAQTTQTVYLVSLYGVDTVSPAFTNCTFAENRGAGLVCSHTASGPVHAELRNCIVWGNAGPLAQPGTPVSVTAEYSDLQDGLAGTGNISVDPLFEAQTFALSGASPCVDAASAEGAPATDLTGVPRPQGAGFDMGAYEVAVPVTVPDVRGFTPAAAAGAVTAAGLTVGAQTDGYDFTVPAGNIAGQSPAAGAEVPLHSPVDLVVSLGSPAAATVPDVVGMGLEDANDALAAAGLAVGSVARVFSGFVPVGEVMRQNPPAGTASHTGAEIDLVISSGVDLSGVNAVRVDGDNTSGIEDGTTWATAFSTVQEGIAAVAASGHAGEVWVAEGTYTAAVPGTVVVTMQPYCDLYGGFSGVETRRDQRDYNAHVCQIDGLDASACVYGADNARIDGFTITGGNGPLRYGNAGDLAEVLQPATGLITGESAFNAYHVIAVDNSGTAPTMANCVLSDNPAKIIVGNAPELRTYLCPRISGCTFTDGARSSVAVFNCVPIGVRLQAAIEDCSFEGAQVGIVDFSDHGGCGAAVSRSVFAANQTAYATLALGGGTPSARFDDCLFTGQTQQVFLFFQVQTGGSMNMLLSNCTIARNSGTKELLCGSRYYTDSPAVQVELRNCLVWGNTTPLMGAGGAVVLTATYCDLQEPWPGTGNLSVDPLFDGLTCRISGASPCVDAACAGYASGTDLLGVPRPQGAGVDMGAYEVAAPVTVPDVRGLAPDAAGTLLAGAGLAAGGVSQDYDATVPFGLVAGQTPAAGAQVPRHTPVNMVTSLGPPLTIPDLAGMTQEDAADALAGIGLAIGSVTHGYSITVPAGRILSQTPAAGTPLSAGIRVDIVISLGAIAVPGVAGLTENAASTAITSAGLVVGTIAREYSLTVPAGGIVSQTPAAGTLALPDTAVNLVVSRGALTVPDVTGQTLSNAVLAIQAAQLSGGSLTQEYSLTVPQGSVISQFPAAGTAVLPGTEVNLILSRGGIAVPNVVGQTQNAAAATLAAAQIVVGTFTEQYSLTVPSGTVISQSVTAGTQVLPGAAVNLVVSRGGIAVPNVVGQTQSAASATLTGAQLAVGTITEQYSLTVPSGTVISQSVTAGTQVLPGATVNLVVSRGGIAVPNVVGQTQSAASATLTGAQLAVGTITEQYSLTVPSGTVISQSVTAGTQVLPGAPVNLVVSRGGIAVPNVVGQTQSAASATLTGAQLAVGTITEQYSLTVPSGRVIYQSVTSGTQVLPGAAVNLVVSRGGIAVPNVVGQTQSAASAALTGAQLAVGAITEQYSVTVPSGRVISQSIMAGTQVLPGVVVNLVLSRGGIAVPNVVGQTQSAASAALTGAQLAVGTITEQASTTVPAGTVLSQTPVSGAQVLPGTAVNLVISVQSLFVPDTLGRTQSEALALFREVGIVVRMVTQQYSVTVPAGSVVSQSVLAGTPVTSGMTVDLVVSRGGIAVPGVVGQAQAAAEAAIAAAQMVVGPVTRQYSATVPVDAVISQDPAAGTSALPGTAVGLVISRGAPPVAVPNVVGQPRAEAESAIAGAGLATGAVTESHSAAIAAGSVISQSPAAGTEVSVGTAVSIVVSLGPAMAGGEGEPVDPAAVEAQLAGAYDAADSNGDGTLSFAEAAAAVAGLTQSVFDAIDTNSDGQLTPDELGMDAGTGCAGCRGTKSGLSSFGYGKGLSDLFLMALGVTGLAAMSALRRP